MELTKNHTSTVTWWSTSTFLAHVGGIACVDRVGCAIALIASVASVASIEFIASIASVASLHRLRSRCLYHPPPRITFTAVLARILQSNHNDQLLMYSQSSRTTSSKSFTAPLPLSCHNPVIPGFMLSRR